MRSFICATVIALSLPLAGAAAQTQAPLKIAYVNPQALMAAAPGRAAAESLLTKEGDSYRAQLQTLQDSVNNMLAKYQKDEPTLTAAQKDSRQKAMQALETELQGKNAQFQQQFQQHENEVMAPVTEQVRKVLDDIRTEGGYSLILSNDPQGSPIVSADKNLDITDRVVARLRTVAATTKPAAAKPAGAPPAPAGVTRKPPIQ
jgi:outer membrane protein